MPRVSSRKDPRSEKNSILRYLLLHYLGAPYDKFETSLQGFGYATVKNKMVSSMMTIKNYEINQDILIGIDIFYSFEQ